MFNVLYTGILMLAVYLYLYLLIDAENTVLQKVNFVIAMYVAGVRGF
jgi:hypothetical protein